MKQVSRHLLIAAMLSILTFGCAREKLQANADSRDEPTSVRTIVVQGEPVLDLIRLPADVRPSRQAVIAAEVPGTVTAVHADLGDRVAKGDLLVSIDTRTLKQAVAEAEAVLRQAQEELDRSEALYETRSITRGKLSEATTNHDVAAARLARARLDLDRSQIRAPWSGSVALRHVEVGDYLTPGRSVVELVDVEHLEVMAPVPSPDVPWVEVGAQVRVGVDAFPGEVFEGRIVRLGATLDPATRTLPVEAELSNEDGRIRPGMPAAMQLVRRTLPDALLVPLHALIDFEQGKVVYVVEDGSAARRQVQLGPRIGERVVIEQGLQAGDHVVVEGQGQISDGEPVRESVSSPAVED